MRKLTRAWRAAAACAVLVGTVIGSGLADPSPAAAAGPCGPPVVNPVACENTRPGTPPSDWQVVGDGDTSIVGFTTSMSVNVGDAVTFKIKTAASSYHLDILRLGYYQGNGARKVAAGIHPSASLPQSQPACLTGPTGTGLIDCGNWAASASWSVPSDAVSGVYEAHLVRDDTGGCESDPLRRAGRLEPLRRRRADVGHHMGGLQHLRRKQPLHVRHELPSREIPAPTRAPRRCPTTVRSRRRPTRTERRSSTPSSRWFGSSRRMAMTSATCPVSMSILAAHSCSIIGSLSRAVTTSTGRVDNGRTSKRRATPESTSRSSAATRSSGRRGGSRASTARPPPDARSCPTRRRTTTRWSIHMDPPVWTGTWADPRFSPPGRRRPSPERPDRPVFRRERGYVRHPGAVGVSPPASVAQHGGREAVAGSDRHTRCGHRNARLRVGRRPRQRLPPRRAHRPVLDDRRRSEAFVTDYGTIDHDRDRDAPPDALPRVERRARLRRRHRAVVVGPRRPAPGRAGTGPEHAAGDGQPLRRHGRAAGHTRCSGLVGAAASDGQPAPHLGHHVARRRTLRLPTARR